METHHKPERVAWKRCLDRYSDNSPRLGAVSETDTGCRNDTLRQEACRDVDHNPG